MGRSVWSRALAAHDNAELWTWSWRAWARRCRFIVQDLHAVIMHGSRMDFGLGIKLMSCCDILRTLNRFFDDPARWSMVIGEMHEGIFVNPQTNLQSRPTF